MQLQNSLAQTPEQFNTVSGLGGVLGVYPVTAANRWISAMIGVILIGGAGLAAIYGIYDTTVQVAKYGPVMFSKTIMLPLIIAGVMLFFGLLAAFNAFQNWNKCLVVYDKGLGYLDNKGIQIWIWHEITFFFVAITKQYTNGLYTGTTFLYTLQKEDGSSLRLDNKFKQVESLGRFIGQKVAPYQYDKLRQQVQNGQIAKLGPISISLDQLTVKKKSFGWKEVEKVAITNGYVKIQKKGGGRFSGASAPVATIPNLEALFEVVNQISRDNVT